jgi:hypothetical protein
VRYTQAKALPIAGNISFTGAGTPNAKWSILNIDDVLLTLLEYHRSGNWISAFEAAIPPRKRKKKGGSTVSI